MKNNNNNNNKKQVKFKKTLNYDCAWCDNCCVPPNEVYTKEGKLYHDKCGKIVEES